MARNKQQDPRKLPQKQVFLASTRRQTVAPWKCLSHSAVLDPMAEIIEARERTMVDNDNNKRRRLVEFKDGCRYGKFGKTKAYELIAHERIRAYKMGGKTMIDLDSVDEYHASLPRLEARASCAADLHSETAGARLRKLPRRLD
jgi:excisionase family DNA binding protein